MRLFFPVLDQCIYLNTAYTGPTSTKIQEWNYKDDILYNQLGDQYKKTVEKDYLSKANLLLSEFVNAPKETTFISSNFSSAFQSFLIHLPKEFHFLLLEDEYPSLQGFVKVLNFLI